MNRRHFIANTGVLGITALLLQNRAWGALLKGYDFNVRMLRDNVGIFTERGGTIGFVLAKDGVIIVDAQFPDTAVHLIDDLKKRSTIPLRFLLNTHHHGDHTSGNIAFKGIVESVIAQVNCVTNQKNAATKNNSLDKQLFADITFESKLKLKSLGDKLEGHYFGAAHTNGDAVYHFKDTNIMHVGDLMFNKRHPYVDKAAGANMNNWIKVLDKVIKEGSKDTLYIFGHSLNAGEETGTAEDIKKFQDYLGKVLRFAEQEVKKGVSKAEFVKNTSIPGVTDWTGHGIERPLTAAWEEITTGK